MDGKQVNGWKTNEQVTSRMEGKALTLQHSMHDRQHRRT